MDHDKSYMYAQLHIPHVHCPPAAQFLVNSFAYSQLIRIAYTYIHSYTSTYNTSRVFHTEKWFVKWLNSIFNWFFVCFSFSSSSVYLFNVLAKIYRYDIWRLCNVSKVFCSLIHIDCCGHFLSNGKAEWVCFSYFLLARNINR